MKKENIENQEPVLVQIPGTNKYVNVKPVMDLVGGTFNNFEEVAEAIDDAIRSVTTDYFKELSSEKKQALLKKIYALKDAFKKMTIIES